MLNFIKNISIKFGFTETEIKVILFLTITFLIGLTAYYFKLNNDQIPYKEFDYSRQDSLFNNAGKNNKSALNASKNVQKRVDYKQELLDFRNDKFSLRKESKPVLKEKSINLNSAGVKELSRLPGIGLITAQKIIELREKKDGFNVLKELLEVKGIGNIKFNNIKSFVFIE